MIDIGRVVIVDRSKRAIAAWFEVSLELDLAQECLGRAPDVVANDVVSWGRVTSDEIRGLLAVSDDETGGEVFAELVAKHAASDTFISLFWQSDRTVARGE